MNVWIAIGLTTAGCYLVKLLGLSVPAGALERPAVKRLAALLPIALLAALTAQQTFGEGPTLVLDARAAGSPPRRWHCCCGPRSWWSWGPPSW